MGKWQWRNITWLGHYCVLHLWPGNFRYKRNSDKKNGCFKNLHRWSSSIFNDGDFHYESYSDKKTWVWKSPTAAAHGYHSVEEEIILHLVVIIIVIILLWSWLWLFLVITFVIIIALILWWPLLWLLCGNHYCDCFLVIIIVIFIVIVFWWSLLCFFGDCYIVIILSLWLRFLFGYIVLRNDFSKQFLSFDVLEFNEQVAWQLW